ncbi:RagB/SusD family nutrient uptake outer membrane protein [Chitinophaga agrisoli]|uniref:RagB/SusD family nutrient uptake outer membrane protein n=1 Tax=Chitinophaga agrisoli TaxID=2607653 RepID=A0A5B2VXL9_9BACT|nr:RagB/SusD family nutrient uptake outer membrane protein [Chitinophaga agrisoli]KAA2243358.1 RagB/SusD family nutrient uptake outer membrane protein [Chitinophaga agrisoli]
MKQLNRKFLSLLCIGLIIQGCSKNFIELNPISNANEGNFYKTQDDFLNAIYGAYATLKTSGQYDDNMQLVGDLRSDNTEMGTTASTRFSYYDLTQFNVQPTSPIVESIWNDNYVGIRDVNMILDRIVDAGISADVKTQITGEAQFLRGLFYFNLVRVFGKVPLVTKSLKTIEEAYSFGRADVADVADVYKQIVTDLTVAEAVLPLQVTGQEGRATKGAAGALLGKVYLTMHNYAGAKDILNKVISSGQYDLLPDYKDLWDAKKKNSKESVFAVQFLASISTSTGANFTERYFPYQYPLFSFSTTGGGYNIPTEDLIAAYESGDLRKAASLRESYTNANGQPVTGLQGRFEYKFHDESIKSGGSNDNWPVLRYADVLLMYAEALNELSFEADGMALSLLNRIRQRAGLPEKTATNANPALRIASQADFRLAMEQERRVEFAFEGQRWFDLVRTDRAIAVLGPKVQGGLMPAQLVLPVPLSQIDVNPAKIDQNPGAK